MARAATAAIAEQLCLVVVATSEEVVSTLAADGLGLEGQGSLEPLQLKDREMREGGEEERREKERKKGHNASVQKG